MQGEVPRSEGIGSIQGGMKMFITKKVALELIAEERHRVAENLQRAMDAVDGRTDRSIENLTKGIGEWQKAVDKANERTQEEHDSTIEFRKQISAHNKIQLENNRRIVEMSERQTELLEKLVAHLVVEKKKVSKKS